MLTGGRKMKYYHMIIARPAAENMGDTSTRREYIARRQGSCPAGWICLGVCGYHETPKKRNTEDTPINTGACNVAFARSKPGKIHSHKGKGKL